MKMQNGRKEMVFRLRLLQDKEIIVGLKLDVIRIITDEVRLLEVDYIRS